VILVDIQKNPELFAYFSSGGYFKTKAPKIVIPQKNYFRGTAFFRKQFFGLSFFGA
jgi:hypothetical protein